MNRDYLYIDVIPLLTAEEAGGFSRAATRRRGLAVAATLDASGEFRMFRQDDCRNLVDQLRSAKCVVGYNCIKFDYELIRGHVSFRRPKTIDVILVLDEALGFRPTFREAVVGTLGNVAVPDLYDAFPVVNTLDWNKISKTLRSNLFLLQSVHEHLRVNRSIEITKGRRTRTVKVTLKD